MIAVFRKQWQLLLAAFMFYTRIPVPFKFSHHEDMLNSATRYLPLIGWIIGAFSAAVFLAASLIWPVSIAIWSSMVISLVLTGAFHEDGFADACDGFGGGWETGRTLEIMKDSRIGAFAAFGTFFMLSGKFLVLKEIAAVSPLFLAAAMVGAHSLSRWAAVAVIWSSNYVRANEDGKAKPLARSFSNQSFFVATVLTLLPLALLPLALAISALIVTIIVAIIARSYLQRWIGGYTGDCLGALQQLSELGFYLLMSAGLGSGLANWQCMI